jgi:crotonobetainyl-CoA:carnitine CoA-transferase CaiB-like acyl-CoA transferase
MVVEVQQPGAAEPVRMLGAPVKLSRTPADVHRRPAPALGEDTLDVLREAGYDPGRLAALRASGAIAGPPGAAGDASPS